MDSTIVVLKALLTIENYVQYGKVLHSLKNLSRESSKILAVIHDYYEKFAGQAEISVTELELFFYKENPAVDRELYDMLFQQIRDAEQVNADLVKDLLNRVVEQHVCSEINQVAVNAVQGLTSGGIEDISSLVESFREKVGALVDPLDDTCTMPLADILKGRKEGAANWGLSLMQEVLGPLIRGTLGHIFARPDGGKTTLALNQLAHFAYQARSNPDQVFLFLNNEEAIQTCRMRLIQSLTGLTIAQLERDPAGAEDLFQKKGGGKIYMVGGVSHITDVEKYISKFNPVVCFIDQGPKVVYPGKDLDSVERKQRLYNRLRELAKKYNVAIVTVGQADAESDNRKFLEIHNLDGSKVGIPGECDWMMGIGKLEDEAYAGTRFLSICKNKLRGATGKGTVLIDVPTCRFRNA